MTNPESERANEAAEQNKQDWGEQFGLWLDKWVLAVRKKSTKRGSDADWAGLKTASAQKKKTAEARKLKRQ